jgi:hypothetical protein
MRPPGTQQFLWLRRFYQATFLLLFVFLTLVTTASWLQGFPVDWFLDVDPLIALSTALATWTLQPAMVWALVLAVLTLVFGRFFCGWICPFGVLHHFLGWFGRLRRIPDRVKVNLPRSSYKLKYFVLIALLVTAALASTQIGLLDPLAFLWRAFATVVIPATGNSLAGLCGQVGDWRTVLGCAGDEPMDPAIVLPLALPAGCLVGPFVQVFTVSSGERRFEMQGLQCLRCQLPGCGRSPRDAAGD